MTRTTLAFAHANGIPGGSYAPFLAALSSQYDLAVVDRIGHDPAYPVDHDWQSLSREMESFLEPLPRPLVGVGHSLGSVLMFMVASRRPTWFSALVMLDPPLVNGWFRPAYKLMRALGQVDRVTPAGKSLGRLDYWADRASAEAYFRSRSLFAGFDPRALDAYLQHGIEAYEDGWRLRFRPDKEVAIFRETPANLHRVARLSVPAALITGADSPGVFHAAHRRHVRRHRMLWCQAEGGHMYPLERPEETAALLLSVLASLTGETKEAADVA